MDSKKKEYISFLNVISAIAVVFLHTNGCFWVFSKSRYWFTANIIECIFYFAVPIFFMITGITLLDYREKYSTKEYFKKRILKAVIPFIIWSIISLIFCLFYSKNIKVSELNFKMVFNGIMGTGFVPIYWFFIHLFIIYLTIPILSSIEKKNRDNVFVYIIVMGFILNSVFPLINSIFNLNLYLPVNLIVGTQYIIYSLIGYILDKNKLTKNKKIIIYVLGFLGLLVHIVMTYILSNEAGEIVKIYKEYCNVPCILYSTAIFVFLKSFFERFMSKKKILNKVINILCKYTFPIYLMHYYVIKIISNEFDLNTTSIIYRLGMPFVVIPICIGITWLLRKIPIVKKIVP